MKVRKIEFGPQVGPQTRALECEADILFFGGQGGGGKSYALLLEPIRHYNNPKFESVIFRRTVPQITNPGSLWSVASDFYSMLSGSPNQADLAFKFPSGMSVKFSHLQHESDKFKWQGSQAAFIGFDEVTHFTESQFWYMLSRNRSTSGVQGYIRATCNPDPDGWVRRLLDWWIGEDGFPIPERDGVIRWFTRVNNEIIWTDHKSGPFSKSLTFIKSSLSDNKILEEKDPSYRANLEALPYVERMQLLGGNWNVRPAAGLYFKKHYFEIVEAVPAKTRKVRYWDRASSENPDADRTAGCKMEVDSDGVYYVTDMVVFRGSPLKVKQAIRTTATQDGRSVIVGIEQDPGQAGVAEAQDQVRNLAGYSAKLNKPMVDKVTRASPFSAQCEAGNVKLLKGPWNDAFIAELEGFPEGKHDDQVDSSSGAFHLLTNNAGQFSEEFVGGAEKEDSDGYEKPSRSSNNSGEPQW